MEPKIIKVIFLNFCMCLIFIKISSLHFLKYRSCFLIAYFIEGFIINLLKKSLQSLKSLTVKILHNFKNKLYDLRIREPVVLCSGCMCE